MVNIIANEAAYLRFPRAGTLENTEILSKYEKKRCEENKATDLLGEVVFATRVA